MTEKVNQKESIEEIRNNKIKKSTNNEKKEWNIEDISMPEPPIVDLPSLNDVVDCDSFLQELSKIPDIPFNVKLLIMQKWHEIKYLAQLVFYNTINKTLQLSEFIKEFWTKLKNTIKNIIDEIYESYKDIIAYFKGSKKKLITLFKKMKKSSSEEEKKQLKEKILSFGDNILEMLCIYEIWEILKSLWNMLKNLWGNTKDAWNDMIKSINHLKELSKDKDTAIIKKIIEWINTLLPLLATLALATLAAIDMSKKKQKANEKTLEEGLKDIEKPNDISDLSLLLKEAKKTQNEIESKENISVQEDSSIISICPIETPDTSLSKEDYGGYAIEIGLNYSNFSFTKNINDNVKVNDVIGYVENIPIKSKIEGTVIEKRNRHILLKPNENEEIKEIEQQEDENINSLINAFESIGYIEDVLKNHIIYTYKTILYKNTIFNPYSNTNTNKSYKDIINSFKEETEKLEEKIEKICSKDNINKKIEKENGLLEIKDEIMKLKKDYFFYIFDKINKNQNSLYSNEQIDYKLCDFYYDMIIDIDYNDKNKYKIELLNILLSFIQDRKKIEIWNKDIKKNINDIAIKIDKNKNYFFEHNIKNNIGVLNLNNIKETYEYIKKIFNIKNPQSTEIKMDSDNINNDTISNITNSNNSETSEEDKKNINNDKLAKKIAVLLYIWHNCENTTNNEKTLLEQTNYEFDILIDYYKKLEKEYISNNKIINDIDFYKEVSWPCAGTIYIDNLEYKHYLFINNEEIVKSNIVNENDGNNQLSTKTKYEPTTYQYWLRYCTMATMVNCAMPIYWSTGFLALGAPVPLPIILIPIHVISGECTCVIGISICGIWVEPMMLFCNVSSNLSSYILPINIILELTKNKLEDIKKKTTSKTLKEKGIEQIKMYDNLIRDTEKEIENIKKEMDILKSM